jgi:hypothetical protein
MRARKTPQTPTISIALATKQSVDKAHDSNNTDCAHNMTPAAECTCAYGR